MTPATPAAPEPVVDEISALIEVLHHTGQRLEELTGGEVDAVTDRNGRTFILRRAQDQLRQSEAARQAAILNALPAHIALLDTQGVIISVNEAWRNFADANGLLGPGHAVGLNYVALCEQAIGNDAPEARRIAAEIRLVLCGDSASFSTTYACHTATQERWFLISVTPLGDGRSTGAIVMHLNVTTERQSSDSLRNSELRFRQMAENIRDVFYLYEADGTNMLYISPAYAEIWGRSCESLYAHPQDWTETIHRDDWAATTTKYQQALAAGEFELEFRIVRPDGSIRWIESRGFPIRDPSGAIVRITGVARDITQGKQQALDLRESERRFSTMLQNVELASVMLDLQGRITYCNPWLLALTGWSSEEVIGQDWFKFFLAPEFQDTSGGFAALLAGQPDAAWPRDNEILTRSGERRMIRWNNSVLRSGSGAVIGSASIGQDITEQTRSSLRIKRLNRVYAMLSGINSLQVRVTDRDELLNEACRIAVEAGGFQTSWIGMLDRVAMQVDLVASAGLGEELAQVVQKGLSLSNIAVPGNTVASRVVNGKESVVFNNLPENARNGFGAQHVQAGVLSMALLPLVVAGEAVGVFALCADELDFFQTEELGLLSELAGDIAFAIDHIGKQERIAYLAYYDVLTGLANRSLLLERVAQYLRIAANGGHQLGLFLIDVERFKNINDSLGQVAGDALLRQIGQWLSRIVGDANLVARVGADHFAILRPQIAPGEDLRELVEKRMDAFLNHPFQVEDTLVRIAFKAGVAVFPADGADADTLFRHAEAALKQAKARGERYLFYKEKMSTSVAGKVTLENQLRQALDKGEFVLHYQPKVNLASGKLSSAEALIRWNDPRTGLVPPGHFIPILEETGLIYEVGRWALRQARADYLRWRASGLNAVRIAVNVSPLQLRNRGFTAEIAQVTGTDAQVAAGLELEITESLIMEDVNHSISSLQAIRSMGVRIAIDDFGTGFSSLSYLAKLPVDTLKIDRSFVVDMTASPQGLALVSTIIDLAHALNLQVVAEGVETEEQSRLLRLLGCDEMQGYLFSKPLPVDSFEAGYLRPV